MEVGKSEVIAELSFVDRGSAQGSASCRGSSTRLWEFGGPKNPRYPGSFVSRWQALHPVALGLAPHQARQFLLCFLG